uniref:Secreted protein n=1 Tax=Macrostomum lignano TaxID=282301 RepID=A0A1I8I7Y8_9PLAT
MPTMRRCSWPRIWARLIKCGAVVMATRIACRQLIRLFWSMPIRTARRPPAFGWASTSCCRPGQPGCTGCVPSSWLRIGRLPS